MGPDGNLWVCDSDANKVFTLNSSGTLIRTITTSVNSPCGITVMPCAPSDFGDLGGNYPTRLSQNGARHIIGTLRMGTNLDADGDGLASPGANGDDIDHDGDDEDGVTIPTLTAGATATVVINSSGTGKLNAFFDWNNDADFLDASEALTELSVVAGNNNLSVPVPASVTASSVGARFRISTAGGLTAVGGAADGEVEDYMATLTATNDFGDWNGAGAATTTASSTRNVNLRLGATVDVESSVTPDTAASADGADEDGVTMPASITPGLTATIPVTVFNNNTANRFLEAWIDFDNNGTFNDVDVTTAGGERIYNAATPASASLQTINVTFTVPATAVGGRWAGARFRISDSAATTPTSSGATGEIEDYVVCINAPTLIEWDMNTGHYNTALTPSFTSSCLTGGVFQMFATSPLPFISDDPAGINGPSKGGVGQNEAAPGEGFATLRCGQGFPSVFDASMQTRPRANITAKVSKTWCQFTTVSNISTGSITGFVMDIARQGPESPTHVQGYLTWYDGTTHRTAWTAPYALEPAYFTPAVITNNHPAWRKINLGAFSAGGDALPTNAALSSKTFLLELHIYGDSGPDTDTLEFDNFALLGNCTMSATS